MEKMNGVLLSEHSFDVVAAVLWHLREAQINDIKKWKYMSFVFH